MQDALLVRHAIEMGRCQALIPFFSSSALPRRPGAQLACMGADTPVFHASWKGEQLLE
ncbi:MAG: hypothetical protein U9R55_07015 [Pseudomonadota bacterium]|uniref:hypothetical protein n=1 Tax=Curvibacter delicatus TaxID=80879 RepID=UPI0012ED0FD1|nr:hypothetical protein [Curvibacter delicatus]MEA3394363.1 hypothetical protein [Pseudomonadota bacterium]